MFERFTDQSRRVVVLAQEEARLLMHDWIGTEHVLIGLTHEDEGIAGRVLESLGLSLDVARAQVEQHVLQGSVMPLGHVPFTPRAKKVLELSLREALQLGHNYIGTEHILLGLIREGEGIAAQIMTVVAGDLSVVRAAVIEKLALERPEVLDPLVLRCAKCGSVLEQPGALLFGPPTAYSTVRKHHICGSCYVKITDDFGD